MPISLSMSAQASVSTVESPGSQLHNGLLYSTNGFCGTSAVLLGLGGAVSESEYLPFPRSGS